MVILEFAFLSLGAVICVMGFYLHNALVELEDAYNEIDDLKEECDELDRVARQYKAKAKHYEIIYTEADFAAFRKAI